METHNKKNGKDDLLVKYLLGETLPEETEQAEEWISASIDHQQYFQQLKTVWESSRQAFNYATPDKEDAWQRFRKKANKSALTRPAQKPVRIRRRKFLTFAAVIACLIVGGATLYVFLQPNRATIHSKNEVVTHTLPDGTIVTLNKNTTLVYASPFKKEKRIVELRGEAFFDVASQPDLPFVVKANNVTVTVLGTSFNVSASADTTEVIVATGRVEVSDQNQVVLLTPHQKAIISTNESRIEKKKISGELYNYYKTKALICNETPLNELVIALNEIYPQHIVIADRQLDSLPLTATFHDQPLDTILSVIDQTFDQVEVVHRKNQIILKHKER